ncbi:hypothetical protein FISHEDRAFT_58608 [Fistulina hepatica ATCC 64428]|uniref:Uncharacterized protein n=1 Tax=Fistulina hepatica ATCC 64428 TaxID=1128425 RepID=A0A0D7ADJ6_9AGAR|nr:hypothetical protein FISHEDRAFT_58608 [Fistulina hepatica ATCC 64428]
MPLLDEADMQMPFRMFSRPPVTPGMPGDGLARESTKTDVSSEIGKTSTSAVPAFRPFRDETPTAPASAFTPFRDEQPKTSEPVPTPTFAPFRDAPPRLAFTPFKDEFVQDPEPPCSGPVGSFAPVRTTPERSPVPASDAPPVFDI